jgi:hypothetical protein
VNPSRKQLDAAEAVLLEQWRALIQAHRENRRWAVYYRMQWRAVRDSRATAIRAIRAMRKALDAAPAKVWVAHFPSPSGAGFDVFATRDAAEHAASFCDGATIEEHEVRP